MATDPDSLAGVKSQKTTVVAPAVIFKGCYPALLGKVRAALENQLYIASFTPEKSMLQYKRHENPDLENRLLLS